MTRHGSTRMGRRTSTGARRLLGRQRGKRSNGSPARCSPRTTPTATRTTRSPRSATRRSARPSDVLTDPAKRKGVRRDPAAVRRRRVRPPLQRRRQGRDYTRSTTTAAASSTSTTCSEAGQDRPGPTSATCSAGCSARAQQPLLPVSRAAATTSETETNSTSGGDQGWPCRCGSPARRRAPTATAAGRARAPARRSARPVTAPGVINRNQGAFRFSEPCTDCRGSGSIIEHPCDECRGTGVTTRTAHHQRVRIPPGVEDGQRIRLAAQGEPGCRGARPGDLYVTVHVRPDKVFGRDGDDLTVTVPVSFTELALGQRRCRRWGQGRVRVPKGTADGRILRGCAGGCPSAAVATATCSDRRSRCRRTWKAGAESAGGLRAAERSSGFDPRAGWGGNRGECRRIIAGTTRTFPDLGGRRVGRYARADAAHLRPAGLVAQQRSSGGGAGIRNAMSTCCARCSGCPRTRVSTWPGIKRIIELTNQVERRCSRGCRSCPRRSTGWVAHRREVPSTVNGAGGLATATVAAGR